MGKWFGCVDIDIESKNILISGVDIVHQIVRIWETENVLF